MSQIHICIEIRGVFLRNAWLFEPIVDQAEAIQQLAATPRRPRRVPPSAAIATDLRDRIDRLLAGKGDAEIAAQLNAEAVLTGSGAPFTRQAVRHIRLRYHLKTRLERNKLAGKLTTATLARRLGIGQSTVEDWVRRGRLRGTRHAPNRTWLLEPIAEQNEELQQIAAAQAEIPQTAGHVTTRSARRIVGSTAPGAV